MNEDPELTNFPENWKNLKISQQPTYKDQSHLHRVLSKIKTFPKLVHFEEILNLKFNLKEAEESKMFVIQAGDCAEKFDDATEFYTGKRVEMLRKMSSIISSYIKKPCVTIGRIAGQYAKPRSTLYEEVDGKLVEVFRGESVNTVNTSNREPNPDRLIEAYYKSLFTIHMINQYNYNSNFESFVRKSLNLKENIVNGFKQKIEKLCDFETSKYKEFIYTSHEGLLLNYEECFIKKIQEKFFDLSAHNLWIGERTNSLSESHVEFFSKIENPIGIKVSSNKNINEFIQTIKKLNPFNESGKIIIITRLGKDKVEDFLNRLVKSVISEKLNVLWMCDPMHANTKISEKSKMKMRCLDDLKSEIKQTINILRSNNLELNGIHLEATFLEVTECIGGSENTVIEDDLVKNYNTICDPRLNLSQTIEISHFVGETLAEFNL